MEAPGLAAERETPLPEKYWLYVVLPEVVDVQVGTAAATARVEVAAAAVEEVEEDVCVADADAVCV